MNNKLFVGNLSWDTTEETLSAAFAEFGEVLEAKIIIDKFKNRSRGFGFVTMATEDQAQASKESLDGKELDGREIKVDIAKPQEERE